MSDVKKIDIHSLYQLTLRETENDTVQEVDPNLYNSISNFIGKLKREEYDNIEAKIKNSLIQMTTDLTSLLLNIRLEKAKNSGTADYTNLADEEKFILDSDEEKLERKEMILSATLNGTSCIVFEVLFLLFRIICSNFSFVPLNLM